MKTLYFYIGLPTTSETSLQFFLRKNKEVLAQSGIGIPDVPSIVYSFIDHVLYDEDDSGMMIENTLTKEADFDESPDLKDNRRAQRLEFLHACVNKFDKTILIDTKFFHFAFQLRAVENMKKMLLNINPNLEIKVVVFLRRQDRYLHSLYIHRVISGIEHRTFGEFVEFIGEKNYLDYNTVLLHLEQTFGKDNVIVRLYNETSENIANSFFEAIDVKIPDTAKPILTKLNTNMPIDEVETKRILNMVTKGCSMMFLNKELSHRAKLYTDMSAVPYKSFLPEPQLKSMIRFYRKSNNEIADRHFGRSDLFDLSDIDHLEYDLYPSSDRALSILSNMVKQTNKRY